MARECGECTVCCTQWKIPELNKPAETLCQNLKQPPGCQNCLIYDSRPDVCRNFRCGWMQGFMGEEGRPDKSGVVMLMKAYGVSRTHTVPVIY